MAVLILDQSDADSAWFEAFSSAFSSHPECQIGDPE
jgi:hypothetical protein